MPGQDVLAHIGPRLQAQIEITTALAELLTRNGEQLPNPVTGWALIDTGASRSCIDTGRIQGLNLNPVGVVDVTTANGPTRQEVFQARLVIPQSTITAEGAFIGADLTGQDVNNQPLIALIGRDLLRNWHLVYNGTLGVITISL